MSSQVQPNPIFQKTPPTLQFALEQDHFLLLGAPEGIYSNKNFARDIAAYLANQQKEGTASEIKLSPGSMQQSAGSMQQSVDGDGGPS